MEGKKHFPGFRVSKSRPCWGRQGLATLMALGKAQLIGARLLPSTFHREKKSPQAGGRSDGKGEAEAGARQPGGGGSSQEAGHKTAFCPISLP